VGFEPTVRLPVRLISSQVHSTTLPPLRGLQRMHARTCRASNQASNYSTTVAAVPICRLSVNACRPTGTSRVKGSENDPALYADSSRRVTGCALRCDLPPPCPRPGDDRMTPRNSVLILVATAAFTPLAAALGLYDSSLEDVQHVAAPVLGAISALVLLRIARSRLGRRS
jgi:hypothetical protein